MRLSPQILKLLRRVVQKRRIPEPTRVRRALRPFVVSLEPRFVLNASAELNQMGQLVVRGDASADFVQLEVNTADQLVLRDISGATIPITGHPGASTDPLDRSAITSNQLIIDLGGGDDILNLEVPSGLNVTVFENEGFDTTTLSFPVLTTPIANRSIDIASEQIKIESGSGVVDLRGSNARFAGNAIIGTSANATTVKLADGLFEIDGAFTLAGDVNLSGTATKVDLSQATLSALFLGNDLRVALGTEVGSVIQLGTANESAGSFVNDLIVDSAHSFELVTPAFEIEGGLSLQGIGDAVLVDSDAMAGSVLIDAHGDVSIVGSVTVKTGDIEITSGSTIRIDGHIDASANSNGVVAIDGRAVHFFDADVLARGGRVSVTGPTLVRGELSIDSSSSQATGSGGDVVFNSTLDSFSGDPATISIDALGANGSGAIIFASSIGSRSPVDDVSLRAGLVQVNSMALRTGDIRIDAVGTTVSGLSLIAGENIEITGALALPVGDLLITGDDVALRGVVSGQLGSQSLRVSAGGSVLFGNAVVDFVDLTVVSRGAVTLSSPVSLSGNLVVNASSPTVISSRSLQTVGTQSYTGGVSLMSSGIIRASQVDLGGVTSVAAGVNFTVNAPVVGSDLDKTGDGTLVLTASNLYTGETLVRQGVLQIDGETAAGAGTFRVTGGRLEGSGRIRSDVAITNPTGSSPGPAIAPGPGIDTLTVGGLNLVANSTVELQIRGTIPGSDYDQLVVGSQGLTGTTIQLGSSDLSLVFEGVAQPATEYVLVRNDGVSAIVGVFSTMLSTTGSVLASPRILFEGSLVSQDFGGSGRPAYITYAGGDGNDVAIVTAGDVTITADNVTLIQRNDSNLEIRTGSDLASAQSATPTILPIASINDHQVNIIGSQGDQSLFIDLDRFGDPALGDIQYTGDIVFSGGGSSDNDTITILDLNTTTDDAPESIRYLVDGANSGAIEIVTRGLGAQFEIQFTQAESIQQLVTASRVDFQYSNFDDQITLAADIASPERTDFTSTTNGGTLGISIENPSSLLSIAAGGGNDLFTVAGFGSGGGGFAAAFGFDGEAGADTVVVQADLSLGRFGVTGDAGIAAETITINGDISTTGDSIDGLFYLIGGTSITISQGAVIDTGEGSIIIDANSGTFDSAGGSIGRNSDREIEIKNASQVRLGNINAELGRLRIGATVGNGNVTQAIDTRICVARLSIDSLGTVDLFNGDNTIEVVERVVAANKVSLADASGDLIVTLIDSQGTDVNLFATGVLSLGAGAIRAVGANVNTFVSLGIVDSRSPSDAATANITAGTLRASAGILGIGTSTRPLVIEISESVTVDTFGSDIFLSSPLVSMPIGLVNAVLGNVTLASVSIQDATDDNVVDIFANELRMTAQDGIGSVRKLELTFDVDLSATTTSGGIRLDNASNASPTIRLLKAISGPIEFRQSNSEQLTIQRIESGDGNISVIQQDGAIVVRGDGVNADSISTSASGSIALTSVGNDSDITMFDSIRSATGNVVLAADRNIIAMPDGDIQTSGGSVFVTADARTGSFGGAIQMSDGAVIDANTGIIKLAADGDISLGVLVSQTNADDAITIESTSGAITDGDTTVNIVANSGGVVVTALRGIGATNAIETSVAVLTADVRGVGALEIMESDEIDLRSIRTADGSIRIVAGGTMTATSVTSINPSQGDDASSGSRDIYLEASGMQSDIQIGTITAMIVTDVELVAGDDVLGIRPSNTQQIIADDLKITASNMTDDGPSAINLTTNVNDLVLSVTGGNAGDAFINEFDSINLAASDVSGDMDRLQTSNGKITVIASMDIVVNDPSSIDDTATRRGDVEIIAGGERGMISLTATKKIELGGATQLEASQSTKESIVLNAASVVLGSQIQLLTGDGTGIARWFSPRPMAGVADTAFFDFTSVPGFPDNRLSQSGDNDGVGVFSVLIGQPGEAGFTINIDWGAKTNRFQQFDQLPGDQTFVTTHVYTESDILDSTLNGRPSATDPLQVRFAVKHHESIVVQGESIQQATSPAERVAGGLLSSTDNPMTSPLLENGIATFVIPNLTIPVAFIPIRQIIPETVQPEIFVRVETNQFFVASTLESQTAPASATVSREEYFQIRILSIEPGGEDLAPPQRLPDDILAGDNLKELFAELPDGRYEIQYVLGDGNERMLLRVDIRNQQPIVPGEELQGGKLELQPIDPNLILRELQEAKTQSASPIEPADARILSAEIAPVAVIIQAVVPDAASGDEYENQSDIRWERDPDQPFAFTAAAVVIASSARSRSFRRVRASVPRKFSIAGRFLNRRSAPR